MKKNNEVVMETKSEDEKPAKKVATKKPVKTVVEKVAKKVVQKAEQVEHGIKEKAEEFFDEHKAKKEMEKKLSRSVKSKKKLVVEHYGRQVSEDLICEKLFSKLLENGFQGDIKSLNIYYKVEDETAYCVVNNSEEPVAIKVFE